MKRTITCIICPRGCVVCADYCGQEVTVTGNTCPKGAEYAVAECTNPTRTVTATVRVSNRKDTMVSVKTSMPIPKGEMFSVMDKLRKITVTAPISLGDTVLTDIFGTQVIATKTVK